MTFAERTLRTDPGFDLVPLERLDAETRSTVVSDAADAADTAGIWGLLRPVDDTAGEGLAPRVLSADTALLLLTLRTPGPCPDYLRSGLGARLEGTIGRLVLDGVLDVEADGAFLTGPTAWAWLREPDPGVNSDAALVEPGIVAARSTDALRHAAALVMFAEMPGPRLAGWLYAFGRRPITADQRERLPDAAAVRTWIGEGLDAGDRRALAIDWVEAADDGGPWRSWRPRRPGGASHRRPPSASRSYKLYVSAALDDVPTVLGAVARSLADAGGSLGFKVGRTLGQLQRPDKLVAYFTTFDALAGAAARLRNELGEVEPHGVPFSAAVDDVGVLSWAIDPPHGHAGSERGRASWRTWVTERLADALVDGRLAARREGTVLDETALVGLARARIALDGIDPTTWVPGPAWMGEGT